MLYNAFKDDVYAIQWCYFGLSISGSLLNILQLFASFRQNPETSTMVDGIIYTGDLPRYVLDRLFDHLTDESY